MDVNVLLGNGDGSFQAPVSFAVKSNPLSVAVADLDGDNVPDIVTANRDSSDLSVLVGDGDGAFRAAVSFTADVFPVAVALADTDGNSAPDLITAKLSGDVSVLLGNGDGLVDLVSHYRTQETGIAAGHTEACVTGATLERTPFEACDAVLVSGSCGIGFELALLLPGLMWLRKRYAAGGRPAK